MRKPRTSTLDGGVSRYVMGPARFELQPLAPEASALSS